MTLTVDKRRTTAETFWARVDTTGDCWTWTGRRDANGYGRTGFAGRPNIGAHRVSWALTNGRGILPTQWVLHHCDNPPCVNPAHLFLGDATDNNRDRQAKGRTRGWVGRTGPDHHAFKVTPEIASAMRDMRAQGHTHQQIADHFGVASRGHVSKITQGVLR